MVSANISATLSCLILADFAASSLNGIVSVTINSSSSDVLIFTDATAITRSYFYTNELDESEYKGIWNYLRFRVRTNTASDEVINMYWRKKPD